VTLNPVQQAILAGDTERARECAAENPELLGSVTGAGMSILTLARANGRAATVVAMIRAGAPGAEATEDWQDLLHACIAQVSQDHAAAGWLADLEFLVWRVVANREPSEEDDPFGFSRIPNAQLDDLRFLAEKCGGWWTHEGFVTMETWRHRYDEWQRGQPRGP
jgi:hypothetical protein